MDNITLVNLKKKIAKQRGIKGYYNSEKLS